MWDRVLHYFFCVYYPTCFFWSLFADLGVFFLVYLNDDYSDDKRDLSWVWAYGTAIRYLERSESSRSGTNAF